MQKGYDFIIGGGSAGAALAARLSEKSAAEVLLPEAGGRDWHPRYHRLPPVLLSRWTAAGRSSGYEGYGHAEGV